MNFNDLLPTPRTWYLFDNHGQVGSGSGSVRNIYGSGTLTVSVHRQAVQ
jgi:hypothetical protein